MQPTYKGNEAIHDIMFTARRCRPCQFRDGQGWCAVQKQLYQTMTPAPGTPSTDECHAESLHARTMGL